MIERRICVLCILNKTMKYLHTFDPVIMIMIVAVCLPVSLIKSFYKREAAEYKKFKKRNNLL